MHIIYSKKEEETIDASLEAFMDTLNKTYALLANGEIMFVRNHRGEINDIGLGKNGHLVYRYVSYESGSREWLESNIIKTSDSIEELKKFKNE